MDSQVTSSHGGGSTPDESEPAPRVRTRSGGRSAEVRRAVREACLAFLAEGRIDFTMVEMAERAGVSRKTLYRWWPTPEDVLVEGLSTHVRRIAPPDTGSWAEDVREFAHRIATFAADPVEVATTLLLASRRYPEFGRLVVAQYAPVRNEWQQMVERALARNEISAEHTPESVINALVAPLFLAPMTMGRKAEDEEIERTVRIILAATRPG